MAKTYEIEIERFDGGISDDPRLQEPTQGASVRHFDIHFSPKKLKPVRSLVDDMHDGSTATGMQQYTITEYLWDAARQRVWGIGRKADGTGTKIFYKALTDASWTIPGETTRTFIMQGVAATDVWTMNTGTTADQSIVNGSAIVSNQTANGLTNDQTYYAGDVTSTTLKLYSDAGLTSVVDLTVSGNYSFDITNNRSESSAYYFPGSAILDPFRDRIYMVMNDGGSMYVTYFSLATPGFTNVTTGIGAIGAPAAGTTFELPTPLRAPDDNIYFAVRGGSYSLVRLDPASTPSTSDVSSLVPSGYVPSCFAPYGTYMAIGLNRLYGGSDAFPDIVNSRVHIYDMIEADPIEVVDWGKGSLKVLGNLGGVLTGISDEFISSALGNDHGKLIIKRWGGGSGTAAETVKEFFADSTGSTYILPRSTVDGNKLSFWAKIPLATGTQEGIWTYGKKRAGDVYALSMRIDTSNFTDSDGIQSFADIGGFTFVTHSGNGSIKRTADAETYSYTSIYESQIFKKAFENVLEEVSLTTDPLPTAGSVTVEYRINGSQSDSDWVTIGTFDTDAGTSVQWTRPSGDEFKKFHEVQFRIESTGGGVPVRLKARLKTLNSSGDEE